MDDTQVRDHREPGHFWADNEIVDNHLAEMGVYGFAVYMLLTRYVNNRTGQCDPSIEHMARSLGVSVPTVKKAIKRLEAANLILVERRPPEVTGGNVNLTHLYTVLAVEKSQSKKLTPRREPETYPPVGNEIAQGGYSEYPGVGTDVTQGGQPEYPGVGNGGGGWVTTLPRVGNHVSSNNTSTRLLTPPPPTPSNAGGGDGGSEPEPEAPPGKIKATLTETERFLLEKMFSRKVAREFRDLDLIAVQQEYKKLAAANMNQGGMTDRWRAVPPARAAPPAAMPLPPGLRPRCEYSQEEFNKLPRPDKLIVSEHASRSR